MTGPNRGGLFLDTAVERTSSPWYVWAAVGLGIAVTGRVLFDLWAEHIAKREERRTLLEVSGAIEDARDMLKTSALQARNAISKAAARDH